MLKITFYFLIFSFFLSVAQARVFDLKAGDKKLKIEFDKVEFNPFCDKGTYGCARLKLFKEKNQLEVGYIKVITNKLPINEFSKYCLETFKGMAKHAPEQKEYAELIDQNLHLCSWKTGEEQTTIIWRDGITLILSTSDSTLNKLIISQIRKASVI